jgi:hypothetical protein
MSAQPFIVASFSGQVRHLVWASSQTMAASWVDQLDRDAGRTPSGGYTVYSITPQQDGTVHELTDHAEHDSDVLEEMFGRGKAVVLR